MVEARHKLKWRQAPQGLRFLDIQGSPGMLRVIAKLGEEVPTKVEGVKRRILPAVQQETLPPLYSAVARLVPMFWDGGAITQSGLLLTDERTAIDQFREEIDSKISRQGPAITVRSIPGLYLLKRGIAEGRIRPAENVFLVAPELVFNMEHYRTMRGNTLLSGIPDNFHEACVNYLQRIVGPELLPLLPVRPVDAVNQMFVTAIDSAYRVLDMLIAGLDVTQLLNKSNVSSAAVDKGTAKTF